jgi:hypothetical protein
MKVLSAKHRHIACSVFFINGNRKNAGYLILFNLIIKNICTNFAAIFKYGKISLLLKFRTIFRFVFRTKKSFLKLNFKSYYNFIFL